MFQRTTQDDPYVYYKLMNMPRVETALLLSHDLGVLEALRTGPAAPAVVAERVGLHTRPVSVLLSACACMGILGASDGRYFIYDRMRDFALEGGAAWRERRIPQPGQDEYYDSSRLAFTTNQADPNTIPPWEKHPQGGPGITAFDPARHGWRKMWGRNLAKAFDFSTYKKVADLGGACGGVLCGLTESCPTLSGILVELEYSRGSALSAIESSGASDRVSFFQADFFTDPYPDDADVYFMSHVLHDWDDEHCLTILRRCFDALPNGHPVIAQEFLLNEEKTGTFLAVFQWFCIVKDTMGDQRTANEIGALMQSVGFRNIETRPVDEEQSIVIGWKP